MARFEIFDSLPSTQTLALQRLRSGPEGAGWIMAREQTKGVGRHGRNWVGQKGNFMASRYEIMQVDIRHVPQLSFVTALAVYEMLRPVVPDTDEAMRIKWPNDILYKGHKLCGILVQTETVDEPGKLGVVIGIGLNLRVAPILEGYPTVALKTVSPEGGKLTPDVVLHKLNGHLDGVLDLWRSKDFSDIAKAWFKRAYGIGRQVSVSHEGREVRGRMTGLDAFGALRILSPDGQDYSITGGDVIYGDA
ncbi:biotin--[acetyl-CoA-carboxylase] ligase [Asticcacaulis sp. EMRT-3]|uniref:biotin--[acetyl-CoA-carboxylase] ligase n=1 Tax=Asticcacaulis sp. EMRT-3 TaxID=3040349 RepID=UPI0024AE93F9|nr:biotin--[acetyl-CoA-carboxylase] ligase [Asticcacaulis sp. EMRT-3]MDI7774470.1 biotin--[acetyl-CoA-carboxylase] ligase [Asticcacaulis sp. EMRT-3]